MKQTKKQIDSQSIPARLPAMKERELKSSYAESNKPNHLVPYLQ